MSRRETSDPPIDIPWASIAVLPEPEQRRLHKAIDLGDFSVVGAGGEVVVTIGGRELLKFTGLTPAPTLHLARDDDGEEADDA